ncbi:MAG: peptidylprolyl isomerase [Clostridia bacterium]|nr:peptidylprolyl isomerase [Clostridia bacterium]
MKIKRIAAILLVLAVFLPLLVSCGENKTVMTIGDFEVPYHVYRYVVINSRREIEKQYGEDVWDSKNADKAEKELKENIKNAIANLYTVIAIGAEYDLTWDSGAVSAEAKMTRDEIMLEYEDEKEFLASLKENAMTETTFMFLISNDILNNEAYSAMVDSDKNFSNEDYMMNKFKSDDFIRVKQILVGGENAGTDEQNLKKANELKAKLEAGADFDAVSKEYNNDLLMFNNDDGYYIMKGTRDFEFETAAFSLKVGEVSDVVKTSAGYSIIKRYEKEDSYIEEHFADLVEEYLESLYTVKYETKFEEIYGKIGELPKKYNILTLQ